MTDEGSPSRDAATAKLEPLFEALEPLSGRDLVGVFADPAQVEHLRVLLDGIAAPDLETAFIASEGGLRGEFRGVAGFIAGWRDFLGAFARFTNDIEDFRESPGRVLVLTRQAATSTIGGGEITNAAAGVFYFDGDILRRAEFHLDRDAALKAAGIDPQSSQE